MNKINEHWKATSILTSDFSYLYTKLPNKELLMVLNSLIDLFLIEKEANKLKSIFMRLFGKKYQRLCNIS